MGEDAVATAEGDAPATQGEFRDLLQSYNGRFHKGGWNHYGPGYFELDPETIPNIVLSGFPTSRGGRFVVLLDDEVAGIFADLEDGMLTEELPPGTLTDDES